MDQAEGPSTPKGNTSNLGGLKRRSYFVTFWHEYPHELPNNCRYLVTCEDSTEEGQFHGHAFIYFKNKVTMKAVKKLFGDDCHCERPAKNSECIAYVKGETGDERHAKHDFHEYGDPPCDNGCHKVKDLKEITNPDELSWQEFNTWQKIRAMPKKVKRSEWSKTIAVIWIQGPSGVGKSNKAEELADEEFEEIKFDGNFWHGIVDGNGCAVYDDFRDSHMKASEFINFIDYRSHNMNVKGGSRRNEYTKIIITSIQRAEDIYRGAPEEAREQWLRRMQIVDMYGDNIDEEAFN